MNTDKLEDMMRGVRLLQGRAVNARSWANGCFGQWDRFLRKKWLRKARRSEKGAFRLMLSLMRECDRIKEHYSNEHWLQGRTRYND